MVFGKQIEVVLETTLLDAVDVAEYGRLEVLYPEQISAWRTACRPANANAAEQAREQRQQSKEDGKRVQQLERNCSARRRWRKRPRCRF